MAISPDEPPEKPFQLLPPDEYEKLSAADRRAYLRAMRRDIQRREAQLIDPLATPREKDDKPPEG